MKATTLILALLSALIAPALCGCRGGGAEERVEADLPPDASRPRLRSESELHAAREQRVQSGEVVLTETPTVAAERKPAPPRPERRQAEPIHPTGASIRSDMLMVNDSSLSAAAVLYPMWEWIEETRSGQTARQFAGELRKQITVQVRREIGTLLVYEKAVARLDEQRLGMLDSAAERETEAVIARGFGGSRARFESHLTERGMTIDQFREMQKRLFMARSFTQDMFAAQTELRRDELLAYYREHEADYSTEETREFLLIAIPHEAFLPEGVSWRRASANARAVAKLKAKRRARAAHEALRQRDFADVAREFSSGVHAEDGGSWGQIGRPLRAPYDEVSKLVFGFQPGRYSEPIEVDAGWFIAGCGVIEPATHKSFGDVQDEIRQELQELRYARLAGDYVYRLAERAAISDLEGFIDRAVERALAGTPGAGG